MNYFLQFTSELMQRSELGLSACYVYSLMYHKYKYYHSQNKIFRPSLFYLATELNLSVPTVQRALKRLDEVGLVIRVVKGTKASGKASIYQVKNYLDMPELLTLPTATEIFQQRRDDAFAMAELENDIPDDWEDEPEQEEQPQAEATAQKRAEEPQSDTGKPVTDNADQKRSTDSDTQKCAAQVEPESTAQICAVKSEPREAPQGPFKAEPVPSQAKAEKAPQASITTPQDGHTELIPDESIILYLKGTNVPVQTQGVISMIRGGIANGQITQTQFEQGIAKGKAL
jgi:hypothetical protein